jgi:type I restriction enzyme S subunit
MSGQRTPERKDLAAIRQSVEMALPGEAIRTETVRARWIEVLTEFAISEVSDSKFLSELACSDLGKFWACLSEALVYEKLQGRQFGERKRGRGPDFLLREEGARIWIEVTCPEPTGIPGDWFTPGADRAHDFPHREILLRWTAAIKEKAEQLIGGSGRQGYLQQGLVVSSDRYVIAVNGRRMRNGPFSQLEGISTFPLAVEAVFAIGPYQVTLDRKTLEIVDRSHQSRPFVLKDSGVAVPAFTFLDPAYSAISAIWALDVDGADDVGSPQASAVIHNPLAANPLPRGILPADAEYVARRDGDDYLLERREVRKP